MLLTILVLTIMHTILWNHVRACSVSFQSMWIRGDWVGSNP
jgi:hypothetical protein